MKDQIELSAEERSVLGKKVKRLRQEGFVPAIVYGHNTESVPVQVRREDLSQVLRRGGRTSIFQLKMGRKRPFSVTIKQLHVHPTSGQLLHADFYRIAEGEKLKMRIPLHFEGEAPVLRTHEAALVRPVTEITLECYPADLPAYVAVDLTKLEDLNSTLRVSDLAPIDKVTFLDSPDEVIVAVAAAAKEAEVAEAAAAVAEEAEAAPGAAEEAGEEGEESGSRAA
jgi:large subunit ribosomal protein L25